jgi:release factor glutamine methyltransferase
MTGAANATRTTGSASGDALTVAGAERAAITAGLPRAEAQYLLQALLGVSRAWLIAHDADPLAPAQRERFQDWLARRLDGVPLAYLSGEKEFFGLTLRVTPDTLIPRPDTEVLVEWSLERIAGLSAPRVADVRMVDASVGALAVAQDNARRLDLAVDAHLGSWYEPLDGQLAFDLIISNPPYVAGDDHHLDALRHEPRMALTPEGDGLADLRHLIAGAPARLRANGWLLIEHGYDQAEADLLSARGFLEVENRRDLGGQPRATGGRWPGQAMSEPA